MAKKDFSGKNKTSKTYDDDWELTKIRGKGGTSVMAWMPQSEAKQHRDDFQSSPDPAPYVPPPPPVPPPLPPAPSITTAPILTAPIMPTSATSPPIPGDPNPPAWWINSAIANPQTEEHKFANMANALLPTLAPEDQRTLATFLAQNYKDVYGGYANTQFSEAPTEMSADWRKAFLSPDRASLAVSLLDRMKTASGGADMGAGYDYLKQAINMMNQFTTGGVMTREKYQQFQQAVAALGKNATGPLAPYGNLGQLFNLPSFSAGPLVSNTPSTKLFA